MSLPKKSREYAVKLFRHGGSQAARLPKELRVNSSVIHPIFLLRPTSCFRASPPERKRGAISGAGVLSGGGRSCFDPSL